MSYRLIDTHVLIKSAVTSRSPLPPDLEAYWRSGGGKTRGGEMRFGGGAAVVVIVIPEKSHGCIIPVASFYDRVGRRRGRERSVRR